MIASGWITAPPQPEAVLVTNSAMSPRFEAPPAILGLTLRGSFPSCTVYPREFPGTGVRGWWSNAFRSFDRQRRFSIPQPVRPGEPLAVR